MAYRKIAEEIHIKASLAEDESTAEMGMAFAKAIGSSARVEIQMELAATHIELLEARQQLLLARQQLTEEQKLIGVQKKSS